MTCTKRATCKVPPCSTSWPTPPARQPRAPLAPAPHPEALAHDEPPSAALGFQMFLRCGRVDAGRLARPRLCNRRAMVFKPGKGGKRARSSVAPDAALGTIPPITTPGSVHTADMSSRAEFRGQVVSLSSGSCYSISAMLAPRVF